MDAFFKKIGKAIRHNLGLSTSALIVLVMLFWLIGCESKTMSPVSGELVTRAKLVQEYNSEVDSMALELQTFQATAELAEVDLDKQDAIKQQAAQFALTLAEGGTLSPFGVATSLLALLGVGAVVDNRIKDRIIKVKGGAAQDAS